MDIISVYSTFATKEEASRIIQILLEEKLIACANLTPIESFYAWKGEIRCDGEWSVLAKTTDTLWTTIKNRISELHSYEIPCIIRYQIEANKAYTEWVIGEVVSPS